MRGLTRGAYASLSLVRKQRGFITAGNSDAFKGERTIPLPYEAFFLSDLRDVGNADF